MSIYLEDRLDAHDVRVDGSDVRNFRNSGSETEHAQDVVAAELCESKALLQ